MLLFLTIQIVDMAAMATSQGKFPCLPDFHEFSSSTPRRLMIKFIKLKRQNVRNPVVRDINFYKFRRTYFGFTETNIPVENNINLPGVDQVAGWGG